MLGKPTPRIKIKVVLFGPLLTAVSGVSTHINMLFASDLARNCNLMHFQIGSEGREESTIKMLARFFFSPLYLAYFLLRHRPDIVHLNTSLEPKPFWRDAIYLLIAKWLRGKVVYQVHGGDLPGDFLCAHPLLKVVFKRLLQLPDAVVLLAEVERRAYESFGRFKVLQVIPNAVDIDEYFVRESKRYDSDRLRLVYMGRLADNKGIFDAIESLHILRDQGMENFVLSIAGSGPAEQALRAKVCELKLADYVDFVGPIFGEAKVEFWRRAELFVFPTFHCEGLPYAVLESIASGTPIVTTRVGGIIDVITDGVHGVFVEPHDALALAATIKMLALNRPKLRKMSEACVSRAHEHYSIDRLSRQFSDLYETVLK